MTARGLSRELRLARRTIENSVSCVRVFCFWEYAYPADVCGAFCGRVLSEDLSAGSRNGFVASRSPPFAARF
jgi:hypothetical protein